MRINSHFQSKSLKVGGLNNGLASSSCSSLKPKYQIQQEYVQKVSKDILNLSKATEEAGKVFSQITKV